MCIPRDLLLGIVTSPRFQDSPHWYCSCFPLSFPSAPTLRSVVPPVRRVHLGLELCMDSLNSGCVNPFLTFLHSHSQGMLMYILTL